MGQAWIAVRWLGIAHHCDDAACQPAYAPAGRQAVVTVLTPGLLGNVDIQLELLARLQVFTLDAVPAMQVRNTDAVPAGDTRQRVTVPDGIRNRLDGLRRFALDRCRTG